MHPYIPHTESDIQYMLDKIGVSTLDDLFKDIDKSILSLPLDLPNSHSEKEIIDLFKEISNENAHFDEMINFAGGGIYEHIIPSIVPHLLARSEFYSAYTPYQPEISQGTLQAIFDYQTMIIQLTGLDVSNASHYDGSTALSEAAFMACSTTRRKTILLAESVSKEIRKVLETYLTYKNYILKIVPEINGTVEIDTIKEYLDKNVAAYILATPNYNGLLEDLRGVSELLHANKSLFIMMANPMSLSIYKSPAEWGADIAVGDAQVFGNSMNFGGPSLGYIACTKKLMRKMPGRIVGQTKDVDGKTGYVLTLQAREQHIRRANATSNITSNQGLNTLAAAIYLSTLGLSGITQVANRSRINALYLKENLLEIDTISDIYDKTFYNEFILKISRVKEFYDTMVKQNIIPGIILSEVDDTILISTTEIHSKKDLDTYIKIAKEVIL